MDVHVHFTAELVHYSASLLVLSLVAASLRFAVELTQWWDGSQGGELTEEDRLDWEENNP